MWDCLNEAPGRQQQQGEVHWRECPAFEDCSKSSVRSSLSWSTACSTSFDVVLRGQGSSFDDGLRSTPLVISRSEVRRTDAHSNEVGWWLDNLLPVSLQSELWKMLWKANLENVALVELLEDFVPRP